MKSSGGFRAGTAVLVAIFTLAGRANGVAQESPHGENLKIPCEDCHNPSSWKDASVLSKFDHARTGFSLAGQHAQVNCIQCHRNLVFTSTPTTCAQCHKDVHRAELGNLCDRCHSPLSWSIPDMAQRHSSTRFPLVGPHMALPCQSCHVNQQKQEYVNIPIDCMGCHRATYDATTNPAHRANSIGTNCQDCHALTSLQWAGSFNHNNTPFPLTGAHVTVACTRCHTTPQYATTPMACYACHTDAVTPRTTPVSHASFSTDCQSCHDTQSWLDASALHNPPLTGAHLAVADCNACHKGNFTRTSHDCYSCHTDAVTNRTTPVPHTTFPTTCQTCHDTNIWTDVTTASVPHNPPLTGAHLTVNTCDNCHNGNYTSTSQACYSCHASTMATATTPVPHLNFPQDCSTCHTTNPGWAPSTFVHTRSMFPQDSRHTASVNANQCNKCHQTPTDYSQYCCTSSGCHNNCQGGG